MFIIEFVIAGIGAAAFDTYPEVDQTNGNPREFASVGEAVAWLSSGRTRIDLQATDIAQIIIRDKNIES